VSDFPRRERSAIALFADQVDGVEGSGAFGHTLALSQGAVELTFGDSETTFEFPYHRDLFELV
jgi:hypothetical protein